MFEIGDRARVRGEFKNEAGVLTTPSSTTARLRLPDGTVSSPALANPSAGVVQFEVVLTQGGRHRARITGSGGVDQSQVIEFVVNHDEVG